jgi:hypothetical protein
MSMHQLKIEVMTRRINLRGTTTCTRSISEVMRKNFVRFLCKSKERKYFQTIRNESLWETEVRVLEGAGNFLFATKSRPALGPTLPRIKWVAGAL